MVREQLFDSREALLAALQEDCVAELRSALDERGQATFMVSGGSSPVPLYQRLSQIALDWSSIFVGLVDERWVERDHPESNEALVSKNLLQHQAVSAQFQGMKNTGATPFEGLAECEAAYQKLPRPFDLTLLGMGPDGHTASLFPHARGLETALDPANGSTCAAIEAHESKVTGAFTERMTLSLGGLLQSRRLVLLITGEDKLKALRAAQEGSELAAMPVRAVLQQDRVPLDIYWAP